MESTHLKLTLITSILSMLIRMMMEREKEIKKDKVYVGERKQKSMAHQFIIT
jgi:hypothetical protein